MHAMFQGKDAKMQELSLNGFTDRHNLDGCRDGGCSWDYVSRGMSWAQYEAIDCLSMLSDSFSNNSGVFLVASFDLLNNKSIPEDANSLLYARTAGVVDSAGLNPYPWLCGYTNTFDCEHPLYRLFDSASSGFADME